MCMKHTKLETILQKNLQYVKDVLGGRMVSKIKSLLSNILIGSLLLISFIIIATITGILMTIENATK